MFSTCVVLLVFSSISTAVVGAPETVTGHRGERVDIRCRYESGYESNSKYFCKGKCNYGNKKIVVKSGSPAKDERFSLTDDKRTRVFTVSITDLRTEDTGRYWCGVERTLADLSLKDVYSEIMLLVKEDKETAEVSTISSFSNTASYFSTTEIYSRSSSITITDRKETITDQHTSAGLSSVAGGLGSVLLVLVLCSAMFLILKKRKRKSGTGLFQQNVQHNTESVHMYEIANSDPRPSDVITATSSSNQTPASHLNTRPQDSAVYATVTNQQPDSNPSHIHSTNQVTDTDCDYYANMKPPDPTPDNRTDLIYSTVTRPQNIKTNDGPIYSLIKHK
ncbi:CMRF35-like molecule 1 isoform X5 [Carassius gibelio]|uniref:CMRF35-like molecule 1 isoform X5 n=1 Tax=Carassius gibelio TaxID=101364 RepID=UPI0022780E75|nr:CMRF35-like molecule 1 isoform X5 [Carassius gibelio]